MEEAPPAPRLRDNVVVRLAVYYVTVSSVTAITLAAFPEVARIVVLERARQLSDASIEPVATAFGAEQSLAFLQTETLVSVAMGLEAPAGQGDQVLLKRRDAKRIPDLELLHRALRSFRAHHEAAAAAEERALHTIVRNRRSREVTEHSLIPVDSLRGMGAGSHHHQS